MVTRWRAGAVAVGMATLGVGAALCSSGAPAAVTVREVSSLTSAPVPSEGGPLPSTPVTPTSSAGLPSAGSTLPPIPDPTPGLLAHTGLPLYSLPPPAADISPLMATPSPSQTIVGPLHTLGNKIYGANNSPVILRGINRYGLEEDNTTNLSSDDISHAKQWGANFVRVALGEQLWLSNSCNYDPTYASKVDDVVNWITARGMVALLDLHFNTISLCGPAGPQDMADAPNSIDFWKQLAARYKSNPLVAFDLYNEPHDIPNSVWLNGGRVTENNVTFEAAGMQQMYNAIRGEGANNLVFASGTQYADIFPPLLSGYNVVYAAHAYTCPVAAPPNCSASNPDDPPSTLDSWVAPSQFVPVMITEFGWPDKNDGRYISNVIAYAQSHGWGWSVFAWDGTTSGLFDLLANVGPGAAYDPTPSGAAVIAGLNANS